MKYEAYNICYACTSMQTFLAKQDAARAAIAKIVVKVLLRINVK